MAYDKDFLEWWKKYYAHRNLEETHKRIAEYAWIARGHYEFMKKTDKLLGINQDKGKP